MPLYMTEKDLEKLRSNGTPKAVQPKAKTPRVWGERTGLTPLLKAGWCNEYNAAMHMRLYRGTQSTAYYADEKEACQAARLLAGQEEA